MRKVIFRKYIKATKPETFWIEGREVTYRPGQYYLSGLMSGMFHQWGLAILEEGSHFANYSVGIIEDMEGVIHKVDPEYIIFDQDENDTEKNSI